MGWGKFDAEMADTGGNFVKLNIGDKAQIQICGVPTFHDKTWPDGNVQRMISLQVVDLDDGEEKTLDAPKRRAEALGDVKRDLTAKGLDILQRKLSIECYAVPMSGGRRVGKWRVQDLGPAEAVAPAADGWDDDGGRYKADLEHAILNAPTMDALQRAFRLAHTDAAGDADATGRYTAAKDARKADLSSEIPF